VIGVCAAVLRLNGVAYGHGLSLGGMKGMFDAMRDRFNREVVTDNSQDR